MIEGKPWMQSVFTVSGFSLLDGLNQPNRALVIVALKPFAERKAANLSVFAALGELNKAFQQVAAANVFAFNLPPIMGLGNSSGFEFMVQSLGGATPADLAAVTRGLVQSAQDVPALTRVFTTYGASTPQIYLKLDRERAQALGVNIADIFAALQTSMGGYYANDFNLFGRTWQVKVQAEADDRQKVDRRLQGAAAHQGRRPGAAAGGGRYRAGDGAGPDHPLQQPARRDGERLAGGRLLVGPGASRPWRSSPRTRCPPAMATNGRARPTRRRRRRARPASSSAWRWSSPTSSWSPCTKARPFRSPRCCR